MVTPAAPGRMRGREPATFAVRCGWAMAARRLPACRSPTYQQPLPRAQHQQHHHKGPRQQGGGGGRPLGKGDEGPETRRDACLLTAAKNARSPNTTANRGRPRPLVREDTPSRGTHALAAPRLRSGDLPEPSLPRPQSPLRRRRREEGGPDQGLPAWTQPTPPGDGGEPTTLGIPVRGREGARPPRPRRRPGAARPPASQSQNASDPNSYPYTCRRGRSHHHPKRPPSRPPVKAHAPSQTPTEPRLRERPRSPLLPHHGHGPNGPRPGSAQPGCGPQHRQGEAARRQGTLLHGRTKRPRGEGQRARVVEKGALPARKANGNGGKRPSAHGLPACRPSSVPSSSPAANPLPRPGKAVAATCLPPQTKCGHSQLAPLPPTYRNGRGRRRSLGAPRPPDRDRHGAAASPRASRSQPLARTSLAPAGLAARPFTHHHRKQVLLLLMSHRAEGSEEQAEEEWGGPPHPLTPSPCSSKASVERSKFLKLLAFTSKLIASRTFLFDKKLVQFEATLRA
ncbi:basic proline-rich protein-like [Penaeus indicus]|uniref:basic proline-rich protein-like n=1 Tax=Penaeus indicus TaxID=29960 RepID=UPI00300CA639